MKNGTCPKCGAHEVYQHIGNPSAQEGIALQGGIINRGVAPDKYVCAACGYLEYYLPTAESRQLVRDNWKHIPVA